MQKPNLEGTILNVTDEGQNEEEGAYFIRIQLDNGGEEDYGINECRVFSLTFLKHEKYLQKLIKGKTIRLSSYHENHDAYKHAEIIPLKGFGF